MSHTQGEPKKTPLYEVHRQLGARMIEFGGWMMPVSYTSVIEEHNAVRRSAGIFDLCHMGEIEISGNDALSALQYITTNDVSALAEGQIQYSMMLQPDGGIVDDILVYRLRDSFLLVVNAANTDKDFEWIKSNLKGNVKAENLSADTALIAVQGPNSEPVVSKVAAVELKDLKYYQFTEGQLDQTGALISRTGYTGEDGFEIYVEVDRATRIWELLWEAGKDYDLKPVGLGARDTLRLEMRYSLYGNDITSETTPLEAGLGWVVRFNKGNFIGKDALLKQKEEGVARSLVGFKMIDRGIPRTHYKIVRDADVIGEVTSGSFSPSTQENIGMGYVKSEFASPGTVIGIDIRGKTASAQIVKGPFVTPHVKK